jgi:Secretory lipase
MSVQPESSGGFLEVPAHGQLLQQAPKELDERLCEVGAVGERIWYLSTALRGGPTVVSGSVLLPPGEPPGGHWSRVVAWGVGGWSIADPYAPSRIPELHRERGWWISAMLCKLIQAGFAIVVSDYEGLGTPGPRPFQAPYSEGRSTVDAVLAARQLHPQLSDHWFVGGHSGGGHAAFETAEVVARGYGSDQHHLLGVVALEPAADFTFFADQYDPGARTRARASQGEEQASEGYTLRQSVLRPDGSRRVSDLTMRGRQGRTIYLSILVGLKEQYPQISLGDYLGPSALQRLENVYYESIETIEEAYADIPDDEFGPRNEPARQQFRAWLEAIAVPRQYFDTPVFYGGRSRPNGPGTDRVVPQAGADRAAGSLMSPPGYDRCINLGLNAVFRLEYEASSHQEMLPAAASDVVEWMDDLLLESGALSSGKD